MERKIEKENPTRKRKYDSDIIPLTWRYEKPK